MTRWHRLQGLARAGLALAIVPLAALSGCARARDAGPESSRAPHIVLISIDTLRADHLGCYGYERDTSPRIDALAAEAVRFASASAQASWTLPSHMSLMTSQYPNVHGVQRQDHALPDAAQTLAEALAQHGYSTTAMISWIFVSRRFGFAQGFDHFVELLPPPELIDDAGASAYRAEEVTDRAARWLARCDRSRPVFLFVHYFDPHIDYQAPEPFTRMFDADYDGPATGRYGYLQQYIKELHAAPRRIPARALEHVKALYDAEIRYTDQAVGELLDAVDRNLGLDNTLVVLTSDHGEELDDHGSMEGHQWTLYEEVIHVPLIIRPPGGLPAPRVVEQPVQLIDVAPTVLRCAGITIPEGFQGESLDLFLRGDAAGAAPAPPRLIFGCIDRHDRRAFVRRDSYKLIRTDLAMNRRGVPVMPGFELYDLTADPHEQHDLFPLGASAARDLILALAQFGDQAGDAALTPGKATMTDAIRRQLASVGYLGGGEPEEPDRTDEREP